MLNSTAVYIQKTERQYVLQDLSSNEIVCCFGGGKVGDLYEVKEILKMEGCHSWHGL